MIDIDNQNKLISFLPSLQVMSDGQVKEFDRPYSLLQQPHSLFYHMVEQTGSVAANKLKQMAQDAEMRNRESKREE